jgi:hypothetical protein
MCPARSARKRLLHGLLKSAEPSIRWRTRVRVLGEKRESPAIRRLEAAIRASPRVGALLTEARRPHQVGKFGGVYRYWQGSHWALASLADIGYPRADPALAPILNRALGMWTQSRYDRTVDLPEGERGRTYLGVPRVRGRYRRCASQQGNALRYSILLGTPDDRSRKIADWLERWQWQDGGWNCAMSTDAHVSSFMETLTPMRGLAAFADATGSEAARRAAVRASEVFLERRLSKRLKDGRLMRADFARLHYPLYWHYDILGGLIGMLETGRLSDPRCRDPLDWLEEREVASGGWPVDARYYAVSPTYRHGGEYVDWGAPGPRRMNEWVTTEALAVLSGAGRLDA